MNTNNMLYPDLFRAFERVRWNLETDIPWDTFDAAKLTRDQAYTIKMNAITEWAALPATEMFLRDNKTDSDFSHLCLCGFLKNKNIAWFLLNI